MKNFICQNELNLQDCGELVKILNDGGVVILPTDTIYGLACDASNQAAVDKIFAIKERDKVSTLAVMVGGIEDIYDYAVIGDLEKKYIEEFLPGPVTVILKVKPEFGQKFSSNVINQAGAVGFRVVGKDCIQDICRTFGGPIALTSANKSKADIYVAKIEYVRNQLADKFFMIDAFLNAGDLGENAPSMVVDLTKTPYEIIRYGGKIK